MFLPFVIVVADDWGFRNRCRRALVAAGCRVAAPTTMDAAEYFLAGVYPPHVVVFRERERWQGLLADTIRRAIRPVRTAVLDRGPNERSGGTGALGEAVAAALEQLVAEAVAWRDDLTLGVEDLDAPHRALVARLGALAGALRAGPRQAALDRLRELRTFTEAHFSGEDSLLRRDACDDGEEHVREHARLLEELRDLEARWTGNAPPSVAAVVLSLRDSLEGHIQTLDRSLAHRLGGDRS